MRRFVCSDYPHQRGMEGPGLQQGATETWSLLSNGLTSGAPMNFSSKRPIASSLRSPSLILVNLVEYQIDLRDSSPQTSGTGAWSSAAPEAAVQTKYNKTPVATGITGVAPMGSRNDPVRRTAHRRADGWPESEPPSILRRTESPSTPADLAPNLCGLLILAGMGGFYSKLNSQVVATVSS